MDKALPTTIQNYNDAMRWIFERINYERVRPRRTSTHFRLERIEQLLSVIDSPQKRIPAVHIAGTKGKGSTAAILSSILTTAGVTHGLFTSPHIEVFEERMRVNGTMPSNEQLTSMVVDLNDRLNRQPVNADDGGPTYFEVATLLAWMYFDRQNVELVVLETGLGGRLDCTNVCSPLLTIITSIGLDHTHILGDTLEEIASEKAGIMKSGVPLMTWVDQPAVQAVIQQKASELSCDVHWRDTDIKVRTTPDANGGHQLIDVSLSDTEYSAIRLPLLGTHQAGNAALAVAAADFLSRNDSRISQDTISRGVEQTVWPLRFEVFQLEPTVVLDAAHNPDSIAAFATTVKQQFGERKKTLIFASSKDKDAKSMLRLLATQFDSIVLTEFETNPRSTQPTVLKTMLDDQATDALPDMHLSKTPRTALELARQLTPGDGVICGTGSIFLAAELRQLVGQPID